MGRASARWFKSSRSHEAHAPSTRAYSMQEPRPWNVGPKVDHPQDKAHIHRLPPQPNRKHKQRQQLRYASERAATDTPES